MTFITVIFTVISWWFLLKPTREVLFDENIINMGTTARGDLLLIIIIERFYKTKFGFMQKQTSFFSSIFVMSIELV